MPDEITGALIPPAAREQWSALSVALRQRGPAACQGTLPPNDWWPGSRDDLTEVRWHCEICTVQTECLAYAVAAGELSGIWGGLTAEERAR